MARRIWSHLVIAAVVASATMSTIASLFSVSMIAASVFVDVMTSVVRPLIVDEALMDWHCLLASRRWLLVDRYFSLISSWLGALLRGFPSVSIHVSSVTSCAPAMRVRSVLLESPF
jgi:hypothetical protein